MLFSTRFFKGGVRRSRWSICWRRVSGWICWTLTSLILWSLTGEWDSPRSLGDQDHQYVWSERLSKAWTDWPLLWILNTHRRFSVLQVLQGDLFSFLLWLKRCPLLLAGGVAVRTAAVNTSSVLSSWQLIKKGRLMFLKPNQIPSLSGMTPRTKRCCLPHQPQASLAWLLDFTALGVIAYFLSLSVSFSLPLSLPPSTCH